MLHPAIYRKVRRSRSGLQHRDLTVGFNTTSLRPQYDSRRHFKSQSETISGSTATRLLNLTSEMLETGSSCTSVELMISGEVVSRISTAMESKRRALKDTPSPRPSFRSWCSSISVYWRVEPYMLTQAGPRVGRNPAGDYFSSQVNLGFFRRVLVWEIKTQIISAQNNHFFRSFFFFLTKLHLLK